MHATSLLLFAGSAFAVARPDDLAANNTHLELTTVFNSPTGWAYIDLAGLGSDGLEKRGKPMQYCANQNYVDGECVNTSTEFAATMATLLKHNSDSNTCRTSYGSANGIAWSFTTTPDGNCKTTAQTDTIKGGLNRYFDYLDNHICGIHCVRLDHDGTYEAYITLGPTGADLSSVSCTSSGTYIDCGHGGKGDK